MRRLEFARTVRSARGRTGKAADAVMALAQVARERHRLQQERRGLEERLRRIDTRLTQIAGTETRLVPVIQRGMQRQDAPAAAAPLAAPAPPDRLAEVTLQY